jgi:hypothetical protein
MSLDDIDIDSWGKKEKSPPAKPPSPRESPREHEEQPKAPKRKPRSHPEGDRDRETSLSRGSDLPATMPARILDVDALEPFFKAVLSRGDAWIKWMFRHGKFDRATASIVIDIYRKLKKEGFE